MRRRPLDCSLSLAVRVAGLRRRPLDCSLSLAVVGAGGLRYLNSMLVTPERGRCDVARRTPAELR